MDRSLILTLLVSDAAVYALSLALATLMERWLGGRARDLTAHWTQRARLAHEANMALLWLAMLLPPIMGIVVGMIGLGVIEPRMEQWESLGFWNTWTSSFLGMLTARYLWLRRLLAPRVNLVSWLAGLLVVSMLIAPHLSVSFLFLLLSPSELSVRSYLFLGGAILTLLALISGGSLWLMLPIRVVRPAPLPIRDMVQHLARQMNVDMAVKVYELHLVQVNAIACAFSAIGFSRPMLQIMAEPELRAVAAHELAHHTESTGMRATRLAFMLSILPVLFLMKYDGFAGLAVGWFFLLSLLLGHARFSRRLEVRADRLGTDASDAPTYAQALLKLHEANLTPAVMGAGQTHPHLYDRMLAAGIEPDFPRPAPPSRFRPAVAICTTMVAAIVIALGAIIAVGVIRGLIAGARAWRPIP